MSIDLFKIKNNSFNTINKDVPSLFKIPIKLPLNSPAGDYFVSMSLMDGGDTFETRKIKLEVKNLELGLLSFHLPINSLLSTEYFLLSLQLL